MIVFTSFFLINANDKEIESKNRGLDDEKIVFEIIVLDASTDDPIPAAKINIENQDEAYTDFDGKLMLEDVLIGLYDIEISFSSYSKQYFKDFQIGKPNQKLIVKL